MALTAAVGNHLLRIRELELVVAARRPTVGDMDEEQFGSKQGGQPAHMRQYAFIGGAVFQSDENLLIHGVPASGDDLDEPGGETENV